MKTPTRILVGGPEVTSAFVLMGLALARKAMAKNRRVGKAKRAHQQFAVERWGHGSIRLCPPYGYESRNDRKLKAMRRSGSGKIAPLSALSASFRRWDCR